MQCLDFCQTLAGKSLTFSFTLSLGNSFSFHLDTSGEGAIAPEAKKKKKKTPSALRRNARRRAEFVKNKIEASTSDALQSEHVSVEEAVEKTEKAVLKKKSFVRTAVMTWESAVEGSLTQTMFYSVNKVQTCVMSHELP